MWQKAHRLTVDAYKTTMAFPGEERYGLTNQIRRACASIPANIAEGCGRTGDAEFGRFCGIAMGSASDEVEYHLLLAKDLGMLDNQDYRHLSEDVVEIKKMLASLIKKLRTKRPNN